ncbi:MAG: alpha/beta fold hydrolase [Pseudomonadota bacterium]
MQSEPITLVLLPGMDGSGELFAPFVEALGPQVPVVVVRYPGERALGYAGLAAVAQAAMPAGPHVILGESFSGPIAAMLAASAPPGLRGIVLCCSFVRSPRPRLAHLRFLLPMRWMPLGLLGSVLMGRWWSAPLQARLAGAMASLAPRALRARLRAVLTVDAAGALAASRVPLLYLQASSDLVVPRRAAQVVQSIRPDMRLVEITGPHFLLQAAPAEAAQAVKAFLGNLSTGAAQPAEPNVSRP